jgi:hypothetical protein
MVIPGSQKRIDIPISEREYEPVNYRSKVSAAKGLIAVAIHWFYLSFFSGLWLASGGVFRLNNTNLRNINQKLRKSGVFETK